MTYLDSSVLLEVYLSQPARSQAQAILAMPGPAVSSWLLAVEVPMVLRRALGPASALLAKALARFDEDRRGLSLFDGLPDLAALVRADLRLSRCRSLDAVHVGSALLIRQETGQQIVLASLDARMLQVADAVGLPTIALV